MKLIRLAAGSLFFLALYASTSFAQVQRTFVSGLGSDDNPCTRTAPCRSFTQAISQTNSGGEVYVLDSAGYGPFSVNKSISIVAPLGVTAGMSVFSGDGVDINAGPSDVVVLRGLTVNNQGSSGSGIVFAAGGTLRVEACVVRGFSGSVGSQGIGFNSPGKLLVKDTAISDCSNGIQTVPSSGTAFATIDHVTVDGCGKGVGIESLVNGTSLAAIRDSSISGSSGSGIAAEVFNTGTSLLDVERCLVTNGHTGLETFQFAGSAAMSISNCVITHNLDAGFVVDTGTTIFSRGNNTIGGNGPNIGALTPSPGQ